ncbi:MAG: YbaK/EbsC family protein [Spirochaetaceae bacterium]|nr:MAG: YbaK/EbsC family protein [Spirochaetaceae bacterium]
MRPETDTSDIAGRQLEAFSPEHVQRVLDGFDLGLRVMHFAQTTFTSEDAARAIGCELGQIAKSMCLMVNGKPLLVVASGDQKLSDVKLARRYGVGRKKVKIATAEQCLRIFGYPPGGVAPVGHRTAGVEILIDETLGRWPEIHAAAGTSFDNFSLTFEQLQQITGGTVVDCVLNR